MVDLLLAHHLVRSLLEESALGDGVTVIHGRGLQRACSGCTTLRHVGRHSWAHTGTAGCEQESHSPSCRLCVPFASLLESL